MYRRVSFYVAFYAGVLSYHGVAERLRTMPRDDCVTEKGAVRMLKQFDALEARTRFYISRLVGTPPATLLPVDMFPPRYVGLYGGRRRSHSGEDLYDSVCTGAIDNRVRSPSRFGKTVLIRNVIPAFVRSIAVVAWGRPVDAVTCFDYLSEPNVRIHMEYDQDGYILEAQVSIDSLVTLVDALQNASIPGLEMRSGYEAKIALRSKSANSSEGQSVRCRVVELTRELVHQFIGQIETQLNESAVTGRNNGTSIVCTSPTIARDRVNDDELTNSDDDETSEEDHEHISENSGAVCNKYDDGSHYLIEVANDRSLERVAFELGYSVTYSSEVDMALTKAVFADDRCGLIPVLASTGRTLTPREQYVRGTFRFLYEDLLRAADETGVGVCKLAPDITLHTAVPAVTQRWGAMTQTIEPVPERVGKFTCSWVVLSKQSRSMQT